MTWSTFGHENAKRILELQLKTGAFSHVYLFVGPEALGKKHLALEFAKKILAVDKLENHPDFSILDEVANITIEQLRGFMESLNFRPFLGKHKVAVVNNAQNLNIQSQNALLKTLEEPSQSTILILISSNTLLPTIISRCQTLNFNRFSQKQMLKFSENTGLKTSFETVVKAFGLPGKLIKENLSNEKFVGIWQKIKILPLSEKLCEITKLADEETTELLQFLEQSAQMEILSLNKSPKNYKLVSHLLEAKGNLKKNFNKKLVLQRLFLNI